MRQLLAIAVLTGMLLAGGAARQSAAADGDSRVKPVVIELYTSEGCSDCPSADRVLSDLVTEQPLPGVQIIGLGEHVDYWNYLGWRDRFSTAAMTQRQKDYQATVFAPTPVYTPQLVIDGRLQCVGSDRACVRRSIGRAAASPLADVRLSIGQLHEARRSAAIEVSLPKGMTLDEPAEILVAVVEDGLVTDVARGENGGRQLMHDAVVRRLASVGRMPPHGRSISVTTPIELAADWQPGRLRIVAFVQERDSRRIIGAASTRLPN